MRYAGRMQNDGKNFEAAAVEIGRSVRARWPNLWEAETVPDGLRDEIAAAGLFGLSTPAKYGGAGFDTERVARIARRFARAAGVQGLVTVWQSHNLLADWIFGRFANDAQKAEWLPQIASGAATMAFAVSEPGAGAHPKRLSASAVRDGAGYRLNGAKAYVTNGPIAAVFTIVAVTDAPEGGRKRFGAFLVPADAPGLTIRDSEHVDFLKPSGHASLELNDVFAPDAARLGDDGDLYPSMVKPLRDHEDAPGAWSRLGAYERLAANLAGGNAVAAGGVQARLRAVEHMLEGDPTAEGLLAVRAILADVRRAVADAIAEGSSALDAGDLALARDLDRTGEVAKYAVDARFAALGRSLADCA